MVARTNKGWTVERLAKEANCSLNTIIDAELGKNKYIRTIKDIATALELEPADLIQSSHRIGTGELTPLDVASFETAMSSVVEIARDTAARSVTVHAHIHLKFIISDNIYEQSAKLTAIREFLEKLLPDGGKELLSVGAGLAVYAVDRSARNEAALREQEAGLLLRSLGGEILRTILQPVSEHQVNEDQENAPLSVSTYAKFISFLEAMGADIIHSGDLIYVQYGEQTIIFKEILNEWGEQTYVAMGAV